jgi:DNA-binding response OmpR family regulator
MRILVVEDDIPLAKFIGKGLEEEHYAVDIVHDGEQARVMACESDYDLVILDLTLPKLDGISILQQLRDRKRSPVLILTGRIRLEDRIRALDAGADDCVLKPLSFAELSARVRALLRRGGSTLEVKLRVDDLELDRVQRTVARAGKRIELTSKEFALLEYLMRNAGRRVTRTMIIEHVWNLKFDTGTNVVDVYVNERFYNFTRAKLLEGQIRASGEIFEQQITFVASIRDAWQEIRNQELSALQPATDAEAPAVPAAILEGESGAASQWRA